jgi:hypothetical protein
MLVSRKARHLPTDLLSLQLARWVDGIGYEVCQVCSECSSPQGLRSRHVRERIVGSDHGVRPLGGGEERYVVAVEKSRRANIGDGDFWRTHHMEPRILFGCTFCASFCTSSTPWEISFCCFNLTHKLFLKERTRENEGR